MITVEVVYAAPQRQALYRVEMGAERTVRAAIEASGVLNDFPDIELTRNRVGIFSKLAQLDTPLRDGDRVEIYRPLQVDPKEARRRRAKQGPL
ncbi:MAG TPA: RnfH family protein [Burkholderiales bacterium]|jgi:Uncharacterized protein conserved in bacteria